MKNILRSSPGLFVTALVLAFTLPTFGGGGGGGVSDVSLYIVAKGQHFRQTGTGAPVLVPGTNGPFRTFIQVEPAYTGAIFMASVQPPAGPSITLTQDAKDPNSAFEFTGEFATKAGLDAAAPAGDYAFSIFTATQGPRMPVLALGPDAYPANNPRITNYTNLQGADPSGPITIQWEAFAGGTADDFVQVIVGDANGEVFFSGSPGDPGALNGTDTFVTLPADTLASDTTYGVTLLFANVAASVDTNGYSRLAAYYKEMDLEFTTGAPPPPPPAAGRFVFSSAAYSNVEEEGGVSIAIQRMGGSDGSVSVTFATRGGSATAGADYDGVTNSYTFGDGVTSVNVPVALHEDQLLEGNETILLTLRAATGGADIGSISNATLTILDNEVASRGVLQFAPAAIAVDEVSGRATLTVTRTGGREGEVSVAYVTVAGTADSPEDYTAADFQLVFSNNVASRTITIPIVNDSLDESNETFTVRLLNPTGGASLGAANEATVTIRDNDSAGSISFSAAAYMAGETGGVVNVIVRRTGGAASDVSVDFATANISATSPDDYGGTNFTIFLNSNELVRTIPIEIKTDRLPEGDETFRATLRNPSVGARVGPITNATVTIKDDEVTLQFTATAVSNRENAAIAIVMVERSGPLNVAASVEVSTVGGTATAGVDYVATNLTVQFPPGVRRKPVGIRLLNDQIVEGNETVLLELSDPSDNALIGARSSAVLTIVEDDAGGKIQFALANLPVPEVRTSALVIVTRTMGLASNVTARLRSSDLTATAGMDYTGTDVVLEWRGNEVLKRISIPLHPDGIVEGTEQFQLTLSGPTGGATLDTRSNMTVTISDNDSGGVIGFARAEYVVNENGTNAAILITRTGGTASNVTVRFQALEGTAAAPGDFTEQNTTLTFAAGELSKTLLIPIVNDTLAEGTPETVSLLLSQYTGGARPSAISNATLRIVDDESSVSFSTNTVTGTEGTTVTLTVLRAGALNTQVTVGFTTMGGTATEGVDYTGTNGTLTFAPNQPSRTINVRIASDSTSETNESFTVVLNNPQGGVQLGSPGSVNVSISDRPDPNAVPLAGPEFFNSTTRGVTNLTFSKVFNITDGPFTDIYYERVVGDNYRIRALKSLTDVSAVGTEDFILGVNGLTGPGTFVLTRAHLQADAVFVRGTSAPSSNFAYGAFDEGTTGTITIDGFGNNTISGRFDIILSDDADPTKWVRSTGSFRAYFLNN